MWHQSSTGTIELVHNEFGNNDKTKVPTGFFFTGCPANTKQDREMAQLLRPLLPLPLDLGAKHRDL